MFDNKRFKNGFLLKEVNYRSLQVTGVNPTIDELQRWNQKAERDEDKADDDDNSIDGKILSLFLSLRIHSFNLLLSSLKV
jgi:hypothetical protein